MNRSRQRRGFTLVEMLVVMGIIVLITAGAMLVVPGALNRDRSTDAVTSLRGWLEIAQARAARDGAPRGLRLIVDTSRPTATEQLWVTEVQYIESPPVLILNSNPPYPNGFVGNAPNIRPHAHTPRVEFVYRTSAGGAGNPPAGTVSNTTTPPILPARSCFIRGMTVDQANLVVSYTGNGQQPILWLPVLGTWHRIVRTIGAVQVEPAPVPPMPPFSGTESPRFIEVELDQYPDTQLGASTHYVTYHFGIYAPPRPLLGEPTMQLPTNTCVDLNTNVSSPPGVAGNDYDILFAPSGAIAFTPLIGGDSHIFFCVRDPRKGSPMDLFNAAQIRNGGEMMILAIKARSGAIAVQPVDLNGDPYSFARQSVSGQ